MLVSGSNLVGVAIAAFINLISLPSPSSSFYLGSPTILLNSTEYFQSSVIFFEWLQRLKGELSLQVLVHLSLFQPTDNVAYPVKDTVTNYPLLQYAMNHITTGEHRRFTLQNVQNMMIATDGRPKPHFCKCFDDTI
jgi:hypothetical protein